MAGDGTAPGDRREAGGVMLDYAATINENRRQFRMTCHSELQIRHPWGEFLGGMDCNVTSQNGEDGLIAALFAKIGARNNWCFEVGAADGVELSNTWALREADWTAVLIEADPCKYPNLVISSPGMICVHERIGPKSLDRILAEAGAPRCLDFGVIDIDGDDLKIWEGLKVHRPRVVLIEYNAGGSGVLGGVFNQAGAPVWQAGYEDVAILGRLKGYEPVATVAHNAFFVDRVEMK